MDLDDLGKVIPLDDAMRLAKARGPMNTKDAATVEKVVAAVYDDLEKTLQTLEEQPKTEQVKTITKWMRREERIRWLAIGASRNPSRWAAALLELESVNAKAMRALRDTVKHMAKTLSYTGTQETRLKDMTDRGLLPPAGYIVDDDGVWIEGGEQLATRPIYVAGRGINITGKTARFVRLRWVDDLGDDGKPVWQELVMDRSAAMDSRGLQRHAAAAGAPITSANALGLTRYLDAFETVNLATLPSVQVTPRMGWLPNGSFMVGAQCLGAQTARLLEEHRAADWRQVGDLDGWLQAYSTFAQQPLMVLAVIASVAAPLLSVIDAQGFVIDWSGETSAGKTTALRAAASVWGSPDPEAAAGPLMSWKSASTAGPLAAAAFRHSLPLILDDTKEGKPEVVAQILYEVPSGRDKSRADRDGTELEPRTWRTVLLSSGEASILSFNKSGGARARTISVTGSPMGSSTATNAARAEHVKDLLNRNHGHLGWRTISELMSNADHYRDRFVRHRAKRTKGLAGADARVATHLAVLDTALELAQAAGMPRPSCDPVGVAARCVEENRETGDPPTEALRTLVTWLAGIPHKLEGRAGARDPRQEFVGIWPAGNAWTEIAIQPQMAQAQLERWGFDAASVMASWKRRDWLRLSKARTNPKRTFNGSRVRMLVLDRKAVDAANNADDEADEYMNEEPAYGYTNEP